MARARSSSRRSPSPSGRVTAGCGIRASRVCARTSRRARCIAKRATTRRPTWPRRRKALPARQGDATFAGITLSNPDKVYYPDIGLTKLDVARYYETGRALHAALRRAKRPISLVRCPDGIDGAALLPAPRHEGHEQRDQGDSHSPAARARRNISISTTSKACSGWCRSARSRSTIGACRSPKIERARPDRVRSRSRRRSRLRHRSRPPRSRCAIFSLISVSRASSNRPAARACISSRRSRRSSAGTRSRPFAKAIADALVAARPDRYTANPLKKTREGKIFVDYLRNQRGGSAIVNYSTRAKTGAPVACPLRWDELKGLKAASPYTVQDAAGAAEGD